MLAQVRAQQITNSQKAELPSLPLEKPPCTRRKSIGIGIATWRWRKQHKRGVTGLEFPRL